MHLKLDSHLLYISISYLYSALIYDTLENFLFALYVHFLILQYVPVS